MGKGKGGDGGDDLLKILLALLGGGLVLGLIYSATGRREEDSGAIPNEIEDWIDQGVAALDEKYTKLWVDRGIDTARIFLRRFLPPHLVRLADIIVAVELWGRQMQIHTGNKPSGAAKKQEAMRRMGV